MYKNKKIAVIIAAAGKGTRVGAPIPKQYLEINGEPVILKTLKIFSAIDEIDHIFIVTNEEYIEKCSEIVKDNGINKTETIIKGGKTRQESVYNALQEVNRRCPGTEYVLVHDAARPYVNEEIILNVIRTADRYGAAVACVAMKDSIRKKEDIGTKGLERENYFSVQTPQGFKKANLIDAYDKAFREGFQGTDDASLVENAGYKVEAVNGDYQNIKITTKEDLPTERRIGIGFDVHAFIEDRKLILGGVDISYNMGLAGHSDADVLVHAIMDALLGAAALGDIGKHFPDNNNDFKDISSLVLLDRVKNLLEENFYSISNIDATVIAQEPKISKYIEEMKTNIAGVLNINKSRINIKGTTTERLGFTGRGEGIAVEAACSIYR